MGLFKMGNNIEQSAEAINGGRIYQVAGDAQIGPSMMEIIQTIDYQIDRQFESLFYRHAPAIIKKEIEEVEASVNNFKKLLSDQLTSQFKISASTTNEDIVAQNFTKSVADSNFQYLFKDSLEQVIRKKENAPQEVLVELLIEKIKSEEDSDYLIEEAINTLKYLNRNHVNFILLIGIIRYELGYRPHSNIDEDVVNKLKMTTLFQLKWTFNYFLKLNPSSIDIEYLTYKGLILEGKVYVDYPSMYDSIVDYCIPDKLKKELNKSNEEIINIFLPELKLLIERYELEQPYNFKVLSKIANVMVEKCRGSIIMSIQRYKDINQKEREEWSSLLVKNLKEIGILSLY